MPDGLVHFGFLIAFFFVLPFPVAVFFLGFRIALAIASPDLVNGQRDWKDCTIL